LSDSFLSKPCNILISILGHFLEWGQKLVGKDGSINILSVCSYDFGDAEFNVWNVILGGLEEDWDDVLGNLVFLYVWHNTSEGEEATGSVVISFFVGGEMVDNSWNIIAHNPVLLEFLSKKSALLDTHCSNTSSSVGEVTHENCLEMFGIALFSEVDSKISNEFKNSHSNSPLTIFSHIS